MSASRDTTQREYFGAAAPEGGTVRLGGAAIVTGGWAAHEAARRQIRWTSRPRDRAAEPRAAYPGRSFVSSQDALESLVTARLAGAAGPRATLGGGSGGRDPLGRAATRLADAMDAFERAATAAHRGSVWGQLGIPPGRPIAVPALAPDDVRDLAPETDIDMLHRGAETAGALAAAYARPDEHPALRPPPRPALPPLAGGAVSTAGPAGDVNLQITHLESAALPRAAVIEEYRGRVAAVLDSAAAVLERVVSESAPAEGGAAPALDRPTSLAFPRRAATG